MQPWLDHRLVNDDELGYPTVLKGEVKAQYQRVGQACLVVGPVEASMHRDISVAIPGSLDVHGHLRPEDFRVGETADRLGAHELTLDVIEHGVRSERGHPRLNVVGVAGSDVVGDDFGQIMSDIGLHGEFLCIEVVESGVPQKGHGWFVTISLARLDLRSIESAQAIEYREQGSDRLAGRMGHLRCPSAARSSHLLRPPA
jgi:hypothetical protein